MPTQARAVRITAAGGPEVLTLGELEVRDPGPNEVLVSRTVADLLAGSDFEFRDQGERELKGVPGAWHLYAVETTQA